MDFAKFVNMLVNESLHFTRTDQMEDPYEGRPPRQAAAARREQLMELGPFGAEVYRLEQTQRFYFVSCWHAGTEESPALWKLYSPNEPGICIESTVQMLIDALIEECTHFWIGEVDYIDPQTYSDERSPGPEMVSFRKRRCFEFEHEMRAVLRYAKNEPSPLCPADSSIDRELGETEEQLKRWDGSILPANASDLGLDIPVQVSQLIQRITVSPAAASWATETARALVKRLGFEFPVERSKLMDPCPWWGAPNEPPR